MMLNFYNSQPDVISGVTTLDHMFADLNAIVFHMVHDSINFQFAARHKSYIV